MPYAGRRNCSVQYLELFRSGGLRLAEHSRLFSAAAQPMASMDDDEPSAIPDLAPRIKFKRLDKTAKHIMQVQVSATDFSSL